MHSDPIELTFELTPRARFDIINVRRHAAALHGSALDAFPQCLYYSAHTTAGYLEQSLATRLTRSGATTSCRESQCATPGTLWVGG